jgi:hypothetical protein
MIFNDSVIIEYVIAAVLILIGIAIFFVEIDVENLRSKSRTNPMMALWRFSWWRYGQAIICLLIGVLIISSVNGWILV